MPEQQTYSLSRKKGLYIKQTAAKGRGVFCVGDIEEGEILEIAPTLLLDARATAQADKTILYDYKFKLGALSRPQRALLAIDKPEKSCCIVMGLMAFCNHDERPNADIYWEEDDGTVYHFLEATKDIPRNTEICTNYGRGWFAKRNQVRK